MQGEQRFHVHTSKAHLKIAVDPTSLPLPFFLLTLLIEVATSDSGVATTGIKLEDTSEKKILKLYLPLNTLYLQSPLVLSA